MTNQGSELRCVALVGEAWRAKNTTHERSCSGTTASNRSQWVHQKWRGERWRGLNWRTSWCVNESRTKRYGDVRAAACG